MRYWLTTLSLAPLLWLQGRRVRRVTPILPEPPGDRQGVSGQGRILRLLILGDSSAAGVGAAHQSEALSGQLVADLSQSYRLHWRLAATTGHKVRDVLSRIESTATETFDVIVVAVGANDATSGTGVAKWLDMQAQVVHTLTSKFGARHILLSSLPPMHLFPALPQPLRWYIGMRAKRLNRALTGFAAQHAPLCEMAAADFPLEPQYMASDGFHPGPLAYQVWAKHVALLIQNRWQSVP